LAGGPLAKRELEVLRHVSGLQSNAEVAIEMSITIHTVAGSASHHQPRLCDTGG
jgi:DNA-binding CsgD family transcriptional regulator